MFYICIIIRYYHHFTSSTGCEYGDQWSWCGTVTEKECQRNDIAEPCCDTCNKREYSTLCLVKAMWQDFILKKSLYP